MDTKKRIPVWVQSLLVLWLLAIGFSLAAMAEYQGAPGLAANAQDWPSDSELTRPDLPTMLLFLHPECGCSRATLAELQRLLPRVQHEFRTLIVFSGVGETLRPLAGEMRDARLHDDPEAIEARRFGATTSGHLFVYGPRGRLLFHGGITAARGHEGPNAGVEHVVAALAGDAARGLTSTQVFGCPLYEVTSEVTTR